MRRRDSIRLIPLCIGSFAHNAHISSAFGYNNPNRGSHKKLPLAIEYTRKVSEMLIWIRETQSENLLEASYILADTVKRGRTCWCSWDMGHNTNFDMFPERNGVPEIITMGYDAEKTRDGDCFLASIWGGPHADLEKKDITVIAGPAPWGRDARGEEFLRKDITNRKLRPYADIWIETNITTHGAIMKLPGVAAPFGPVSGIIGLTTYWMMLADACRILARDRKSVTVRGDEPRLSGDNISWVELNDPLMDDYFERVMQQIEMIGAEMGDIERIADIAIDSILAGGKVWCYSRYRNSLCVEGHSRRGGLALTRGLCERDNQLTALDGGEVSAGDTVIMGVWEPDDEVDLKNLDILKKKGVKLTSIGPRTRDIKEPEGRTVPKEVEVHVGRMCDTYGLYAVPGFERKVCPTSGPIINQIWWALCMQIAERLIERTGNPPGVYFSAALKGGSEHNNFMRAKYFERGY